MSTYTKITDFAAKDALLTGNPSKIVKGTEIGAEFDSIAVADASNVKGPTVSVTDNAVVRWDTTTGRIVQGSSVTIDDTGNIAGTSFTGAHNGTVGATTPSAGAFTTLSASANQNAESATTQSNTTVGTASSATFVAQSDSANTKFGTLSSGYTTSGVFQANSGYVYAGSSLSIATAGVIRFAAGGTAEVGRFDASGNLLVGQSAISQTSVGFSVQGSSGTIPGTVSTALTASTSAVNTYHVYSTGAAAYRFYVGLDGVIHATNTSITAISDVSLKENIRDLETGLTEVMALQPRRFDWKNGDASNVAGFIAQELETVLPDLVTESLYSEGVTKKSIQMGNILPTLVKAIQEQQAQIESLTARLSAAGL